MVEKQLRTRARIKTPDIAEPVIGRTFARGLIRAGIDGARSSH